MASQSDLDKLAQTDAQARQGTQLPPFPKLSAFCPKLTAVDPDGVKRFEEAIEQWKKEMTFNIRGGA